MKSSRTYATPIKVVHFGFFLPVRALVHAEYLGYFRLFLLLATVCNARIQLSKEASLSANHTNYSHSLADTEPHLIFLSKRMFEKFLEVRNYAKRLTMIPIMAI